MKLNGKRGVVTGGARGIGLEIGRRLLQCGAEVCLWDIDEEALGKARQELEHIGQVHTFACDVSDQSAVEQGVRHALDAMGGVDVLVNNAGFMAPGYFLEQPVRQWSRTVDINLQAIIYSVHAFLPHMQERGEGHIVNVSSAAGLVGVPGLAAYCASKWGVYGLTEALREEAWAAGYEGVEYSSVHPMFLRHGMFAGARLRGLGGLLFPRVSSHEVIARAVVEAALVRGRRCVKRPRSLRMVPLLRGILPNALFARLGRMMNLHTSMQSWEGRRSEELKV
jgi:all-trans-retinol dehydrogenase (NAD+)